MGMLAWVVVGVIAGYLANSVLGARRDTIGMVCLGIVGALVGGFAATSLLRTGTMDGLDVRALVMAAVGAALPLAAWHLAAPRHRTLLG